MAIDSDILVLKIWTLCNHAIDIISTGFMIHRFTHTKQRGALLKLVLEILVKSLGSFPPPKPYSVFAYLPTIRYLYRA